jgi:hypothetical protein
MDRIFDILCTNRGQSLYVKRNIEGRLCNHCCSGKAISITYTGSVCVCSLRYSAWNAQALNYHLWHLRLYYTFPHYFINGHDFRIKLPNIKCFDFLYNFCLKHFSFWIELSAVWSDMYIGLNVQHPLFLFAFSETWSFWSDFRKILKY